MRAPTLFSSGYDVEECTGITMVSSRNNFATGFSAARRFLVLFSLSVVILAQTAISAFAGVTTVNHGTAETPLTVALEVMGVSRTVGIVPPAGTDGIRYVSSFFSMRQNRRNK